MDSRTALKTNTDLHFHNADGGTVSYRILRELGRGGSCIVYTGTYRNNDGRDRPVRIKECYPFGMNLTRLPSGALCCPDADTDSFRSALESMREACRNSDMLRDHGSLTNAAANTVDLYEGNGTLYAVTSWVEGETLNHHRPENLNDALCLTRCTAMILRELHNAGYLYLDLKPDNVFVSSGVSRWVQLFDFDSLLPIDRIGSSGRISCTGGFAPLELRQGRRNRLDIRSDVYEIGALFFWMLFGHPPTAPDCCEDSEYDYSEFRKGPRRYRDRLFPALTDFFHSTLAPYVGDRLRDMSVVLNRLSVLEQLSATDVPYLLPTPPVKPGLLIGREKELASVSRWLEQNESGIFYVTGLGGIGKTSLLRQIVWNSRGQFDAVLFLTCDRDLIHPLADDRVLSINTVEKLPEESVSDYAARKLQVLQTLAHDSRILIAVDHCDLVPDEQLVKLEGIGCKVLVGTRKAVRDDAGNVLVLGAPDRQSDLYAMIEQNLGRALRTEELSDADILIRQTAGHPLALTLIARQISASYLNLHEAARLAVREGILHIGREKIDYSASCGTEYETLERLICAVFDAGQLSEEQQALLTALCLFSVEGVEMRHFGSLLKLESFDNCNRLIREGWLSREDNRVFVHPVIIQAILNSSTSESVLSASVAVLKALRQTLEPSLFPEAQTVIRSCELNHQLRECEACHALLSRLLSRLPRDEEAFITTYGTRMIQSPCTGNPDELIRIFDILNFIALEQGNFAKSEHLIKEALRTFHRSSSYVKAMLFELRADLYDYRLNGVYHAENESGDRSALLKALRCGIRCVAHPKSVQETELLIRLLLSEANLMIRSDLGSERILRRTLHRLDRLTANAPVNRSTLRSAYFMTAAWYDTYREPNTARAYDALRNAAAMRASGTASQLDTIDELIVPAANICTELNDPDSGILWLKEGIRICDLHADAVPYMRKKRELLGYLLEICTFDGKDERSAVYELLNRQEILLQKHLWF